MDLLYSTRASSGQRGQDAKTASGEQKSSEPSGPVHCVHYYSLDYGLNACSMCEPSQRAVKPDRTTWTQRTEDSSRTRTRTEPRVMVMLHSSRPRGDIFYSFAVPLTAYSTSAQIKSSDEMLNTVIQFK
ncbi:hypothetical protein WMY93_017127 [Mugilogobius chulae]|uniref:Uncharacterized protein n=1 Tax=Mugilogobius chulae TaxID=88201 RepID=A0AAW0NS62_9GOBI